MASRYFNPERARRISVVRMKYYKDAHGNLWSSDLVRFYLMGVEGIEVKANGRLDVGMIEQWRKLTADDPDSWAETAMKFEREELVRRATEAYYAGDPRVVNLVHARVEEMRKGEAL